MMTLSSFHANPGVGLLDRVVKRIYSYLSKMKHASLCFCTGLPDYSAIDVPEYGWEKSNYGDIEEVIPEDCPVPKGNPVILTSYVDANLCHDMLTGQYVTGIIHIAKQTVINYFMKKQPTVKTATYGSEFMAARTATEQILDL